jgi:hypothetical protein
MESGLVTFFDVKEFGFYRPRRASKSDPTGKDEYVNGSMSEVLESVMEWVRGREFAQTIPWDVPTNPDRTKIYCKDCQKDEVTGDVLFVFCKALTNSKGELSGFVEGARVGSEDKDVVQVSKKVRGQNLIYGQPMYYWFIPKLNLIASINFSHSVASTEHVMDYLKRCLDNFIPHPNRKVSLDTRFHPRLNKDISIKSVSYRSECGKFNLKFKAVAELKELSLKDISLESLARKITHIVVRDTLSRSNRIQEDSLFDLWSKVSKKQGEVRREKHVEIIEEVNLSPDELRDVLQVYKDEHQQGSIWNNVGFRTSDNETLTKWFDRYVERKHIYLDPSLKREDAYYPPALVLTTLIDMRAGLLDFAIAKHSSEVDKRKEVTIERAVDAVELGFGS